MPAGPAARSRDGAVTAGPVVAELRPLPAARAAILGSAPITRPSAWWGRARHLLRHPAQRQVATLALSVPGNLAVAVAKLTLAVLADQAAPMLVAAAIVNASLALAKLIALPHLVAPHRAVQSLRRTTTAIGALTVVASSGIVLASVPAVLDLGELETLDLPIALGLSLLCTAEIALAIAGLVTAHRDRDPVLGAIRLAALAAALALLVLMQSTLIATDPMDGAVQVVGYGGIVLGAAGIACGLIGAAIGRRPAQPAAQA